VRFQVAQARPLRLRFVRRKATCLAIDEYANTVVELEGYVAHFALSTSSSIFTARSGKLPVPFS